MIKNRDSVFVYILAKIITAILTPISKIRYKGKKIWLVVERGYDARDNGYHMFLYLRKHHPEIDVWYVITRDSADINKIERVGKIAFIGSINYWMLYISAAVILDAHRIIFPSGNRRIAQEIKKSNNQKVIFLQHGIIANALPMYYKERADFDLFICGAKPEYDFVSKNYHYNRGEVRYTGLARFDSLHNFMIKRKVLIMPTWRRWFANQSINEFSQSEYYERWNGLLNNPLLSEIAEKYDISIIFYPHEKIQRFLDVFSSPNKRIIIANNIEYEVHSLLKECALLITDYSSVNFDFAYMNKPVLYYQFDYEEVFQKHVGHGYFDYRQMGFGECVDEETELLTYIEQYVSYGFQIKQKYYERIKGFFPLHDTNNCERIYREIISTFDL
ncbi:CDP-glycerol glycerophosphotransferase family protein [Oribacterium sp. P6A1]|uniref:CDP-glycerol glycerophosphotransferase family protein n=1 Tax=Oribacterium sp. P6A1 TaxID=1410612 RepID=UPI00055F6AFF|nr:CDP-glycerol glycerophosphotransferase family protein [Oribacterium sp. P6A1]